jgi:hypothetical protein
VALHPAPALVLPLQEMSKLLTPTWPLKATRIAFEPIRVAPPLTVLLVISIGVPLAPSVADVLFVALPEPPNIAMPSPLGKLLTLLLLMAPVVKWAVVAAEPCCITRTAEPSDVAATVELVSVLFVIVRLLIVPDPFSIWIPWRRAFVRMLSVIDTVPLRLEFVKVPLSLNARLLSSY